MRTLSTVAYGFAVALALVVVAAHAIGQPDPTGVRRGGLTTETVLGSDGSQADTSRAVAGSPSS